MLEFSCGHAELERPVLLLIVNTNQTLVYTHLELGKSTELEIQLKAFLEYRWFLKPYEMAEITTEEGEGLHSGAL